MIGRSADNRQAERHIHPGIEIERLERDKGLIVIHRNCRVIGFARPRSKQRIRRMRAADIDPLGLKGGDSGSDHLLLFMAHQSVFTGMRIECGNGKPRAWDSEIACQGLRHDARPGADKFGGQQCRHRGERNVDCHRDGSQLGAREHHHRVTRCDAATIGEEFGLPRVGKAHVGHPGLVDRAGHYA